MHFDNIRWIDEFFLEIKERNIFFTTYSRRHRQQKTDKQNDDQADDFRRHSAYSIVIIIFLSLKLLQLPIIFTRLGSCLVIF